MPQPAGGAGASDALHETLSALSEMGVQLKDQEFLALVRQTFERLTGSGRNAHPEAELPSHELELLRRGGFSLKREYEGSDDPLFRSALDLSALVASAVTAREAAGWLGVDPSRVRQRLIGPGRSLYGVKWRGEWLLPRFQFADQNELPGLAQVVPMLDPRLNPVAVARWFLSPDPNLAAGEEEEPMSPRDWLLAGHPPEEAALLAAAL
jgi:hypothetical protein